MYVKVTAGDHPYGAKGDFLTRVYPPIYFDHIAAVLDENGEVDFEKALNASLDFIHHLEFDTSQTVYEQNKNMVAFRYVWWEDPETGLTAVITTRNIFILGETGKTIDRVV